MKADRIKYEKEQELEEKRLNTVIKDEADAMEMYAASYYISSLKMANETKAYSLDMRLLKLMKIFLHFHTRYTKAQDHQEEALDDMTKVGLWGTLIGRR